MKKQVQVLAYLLVFSGAIWCPAGVQVDGKELLASPMTLVTGDGKQIIILNVPEKTQPVLIRAFPKGSIISGELNSTMEDSGLIIFKITINNPKKVPLAIRIPLKRSCGTLYNVVEKQPAFNSAGRLKNGEHRFENPLGVFLGNGLEGLFYFSDSAKGMVHIRADDEVALLTGELVPVKRESDREEYVAGIMPAPVNVPKWDLELTAMGYGIWGDCHDITCGGPRGGLIFRPRNFPEWSQRSWLTSFPEYCRDLGLKVLYFGDTWHKPGTTEPRNEERLKALTQVIRENGMKLILKIPAGSLHSGPDVLKKYGADGMALDMTELFSKDSQKSMMEIRKELLKVKAQLDRQKNLFIFEGNPALLPISSLADVNLAGQETLIWKQTSFNPLDMMPLDRIAVTFSNRQFGLPVAQLVRENFPLECDHAFSLSLLGGSIPVMAGCYEDRDRDWMCVIAGYREVLKRFGADHAMFFPYFSPDKSVDSQTPGVLCSVFKKGNQFLVLVANIESKPTEARLVLPKEATRALDELNHRELPLSGNTLKIKADPYDLLMISVTLSGTKK